MQKSAISIALVGGGYWGRNLGRNFAELGVLAAIVDTNPETAGGLSAATGAPVRPFADVLADPAISAVAIATPAPTHADVAARAIAAGKHVFVEKPISLTLEDADRLISLAASASRVLMVGHLLRYHPHFIALKRQVEAGAVGRPLYIHSNRLSLGKVRVEENVLWSFAPHDVSMLLAIAGEQPSRVTAQGSAFVTPGVADWCTAQFVFPGGVRGHIQASWMHHVKEQRFSVTGETGTLVFEDSLPDWDRKLMLYPHSLDRAGPAPVPVKGQPVSVLVEKSEPLKDECREFLAAIKEGRAPLTDGHEGRAVLSALDAAERELARSLSR
jgi:UDP-2-acetamido-3-amino-2,3-dideoxy-glucuronate N-acetyltransferase